MDDARYFLSDFKFFSFWSVFLANVSDEQACPVNIKSKVILCNQFALHTK